MARFFLSILFYFILCHGQSIAQDAVLYEECFTESTTPASKVSIYLDSIDKYLYRDIDLTKRAFYELEILLEKDTSFHDTLLFDYGVNKILFYHNMRDPVSAYKTLVQNKEIFKSPSVPKEDREWVGYLEAYTFMEVGDLEAAQTEYYQNIEDARIKKDTSSLISNLYSLGQLFSKAGDYNGADKSFKELLFIKDQFPDFRPSTEALLYSEIVKNEKNNNKLDAALSYINEGLNFAKSNKLNVIYVDMLIVKAEILLEQGNVNAAEETLKTIYDSNILADDATNLQNKKNLEAHILAAKGMHKESERLLLELIANLDSTEVETKKDMYATLHVISDKQNKHNEAYHYLIKHNEIKNKILSDEKRQKIEYLKIKYDTEEKDKANASLTSELNKNKAVKTRLYTIIGFFGLFLAFLTAAILQKQMYSSKLQEEIKNKTQSLNESNKMLIKTNEELSEFNRILSHDIKEPLRNIVSFSQLANKEIGHRPHKAKEYMSIVQKGGKQLSNLIEDVKNFSTASLIDNSEKSDIEMGLVTKELLTNFKSKYTDKQISIDSTNLPTIYNSLDCIKTIFMNIIDNGIKFNNNDEVIIKIDHSFMEGNHIFHIKDNGIGIEEAYHGQVFEMFKRLKDRSAYIGSGLGLSLAKKTALKLEGTLSLSYSEPDKGSEFKLSIPA